MHAWPVEKEEEEEEEEDRERKNVWLEKARKKRLLQQELFILHSFFLSLLLFARSLGSAYQEEDGWMLHSKPIEGL